MLSACGSDDSDNGDTSSAESSAPSDEPTNEPAAAGDKPEWARPFDTTGESLARSKLAT